MLKGSPDEKDKEQDHSGSCDELRPAHGQATSKAHTNVGRLNFLGKSSFTFLQSSVSSPLTLLNFKGSRKEF
jgi:hypothetical protein